jgi:hypothetical protein
VQVPPLRDNKSPRRLAPDFPVSRSRVDDEPVSPLSYGSLHLPPLWAPRQLGHMGTYSRSFKGDSSGEPHTQQAAETGTEYQECEPATVPRSSPPRDKPPKEAPPRAGRLPSNRPKAARAKSASEAPADPGASAGKGRGRRSAPPSKRPRDRKSVV